MRYADSPEARERVEVDAPIERVWELISDIELPARFSEELRSARWLDEARGQGARFVGRSFHPAAGEWETTRLEEHRANIRRTIEGVKALAEGALSQDAS